MKYFLLILTFFLLFTGVSLSQDQCYLNAPLPHYDSEKGYGWLTDVKCTPNGPKFIHELMKVWQVGETREIFVDQHRDGTCDKVFVWSLADKEKDTWTLKDIYTCDFVEQQIKNYLKLREDRKEI